MSACAAARPPPPAEPVAIVWPEPPASPRARLVATLPDPRPPRRSTWRRILRAIVGLDESPDEATALQRPFDVVTTASGDVVVADPDLGAVLRFTRGAPEPIRCADREWGAPMALAIEPDGSLLVADAGAAEIVRVAPDGKCTAIGTGELERPTGVAVSRDRIYVADPPRHEIVVLSAASGVVARFGERGDDPGKFAFPTAVAVAPDESVLVVDSLNFRIVRCSPEGTPLATFGAPGEEGSNFARPKGIAVDPAGRIYVSDAQRDTVLVFRGDGSFEYAIGATGESPGRLTHPAGLTVAGGRLYVADSHNRRIQVFELLGERS